jgi:hypothetical protein
MASSISELVGTAPPATYVTKIKAIATTIGLLPGSWSSAGITSKTIQAIANMLGVPTGTVNLSLGASAFDGLAAIAAMSGFLDFAALITPDPPTQQSDGTFNGWLDILADSRLNVQRIGATYATGPVVLTNTSTIARGPFAAGAYHLASTALKKTYSNTVPFTLAASGDTSVIFASDTLGSASNVVANTLVPVTSLVGVTVKTSGGANTNTLLGINAQGNASLVAACKSKLQALSPKLGPEGAYVYFATNGYAGAALSSAVTRIYVSNDPYTGDVNVYIANATGTSSGPDVAAMLAWLQAVARPDGATVTVSAAGTTGIAATLDVYVPTASVSVAASAVATAITDYINSIPIGGTPGPVRGVQWSQVVNAIFAKVPYVTNVENLLLNGAAVDVPLAVNAIATVSPPPVVTVHGV